MKQIVLLLATSTTALGATAAYFWQETRAERTRNDAVQARVAELEGQLSELARPMPEPPPPPVAQVSPDVPPPPRAPPPPVPASRTEATLSSSIGRGDPSEYMARERERMQDPEYRALRREQQRMSMDRMHADLGFALNLPQEEVDKLLDLLAEHQLQSMDNAPPFRPGAEGNSQPSQEWFRQMAENQRKREAEVKTLLGDAKYQEWQEYQQSMGARMQVNNLRSVLEGSSEPLRRDQYQSLVKVIADEQRAEASVRMESLKNRPPGPLSHADQMAMIEQSIERNAERNQRSRDAAASYLTSGQLERFDRMLNQQLEIQRLNLKMMQAQGDSGAVMMPFVSDGATIMTSSGGTISQTIVTEGTAVAVPAPPKP